MNWMAKTRPGGSGVGVAPSKPGPSASEGPSANVRISNGLKEFLWLISDVPHGRVLDLGPIWQATISFFLDKGYRVSAEDLLRAWKDFLSSEEEGFRTAPVGADAQR